MGYNYIHPLSENVERESVRFFNRFNTAIEGDLYYSKNIDKTTKHPAIIIGAPYGGVKEQGPCVYANELAQRGFIVLTFDQVHMGQSGGEPRNVSDPSLFIESFMACVDYLGVDVPFVNRDKIGVIGICGSGGFTLAATQIDLRIKAVATASMYDMTQVSRLKIEEHTHTPLTDEEIKTKKEEIAQQRWTDFKNGHPQYNPYFPDHPQDKVLDNLDPVTAEWFRFYATPRGFHPNARGGFTTTSELSMNTILLDHLDEISPRPTLLIAGDHAHSKFFSEEAYEKLKEPKELYIVEDAEHIDLYDRMDKIPFNKIEEFFKEAFKN